VLLRATVPSVVLIMPVGYLTATVLTTTFAKLGVLAASARLTNSVSRGSAFTRSTSAAAASATPTTSATTLLASPALTAGLAAALLLAFAASLARTSGARRRRIGNAISDVIADVGISRRYPTHIRSPAGLEAITLGAVRVSAIAALRTVRITAVAVAALVPPGIAAATVATTAAMALAFRPTLIPALRRTLPPILITPALAATPMTVATAAATAFAALTVVTSLHPVATLAAAFTTTVAAVAAIAAIAAITTITPRPAIGMPMATRMLASPIAPSFAARRTAACCRLRSHRLFRHYGLWRRRGLFSEEPLDPTPNTAVRNGRRRCRRSHWLRNGCRLRRDDRRGSRG